MRSDFQPEEQCRYFVRLSSSATTAVGEVGPILDQLIARTRAAGAAVYRFEPGSGEFHAVAVRSKVTPKIPEIGITLGSDAGAWLKSGSGPLQVAPAFDVLFENLPEVLQYGYRRLLFLPLRQEGRLLGFLTLGSHGVDRFSDQTVQDTVSAVRAVEASFERSLRRTALRRTA